MTSANVIHYHLLDPESGEKLEVSQHFYCKDVLGPKLFHFYEKYPSATYYTVWPDEYEYPHVSDVGPLKNWVEDKQKKWRGFKKFQDQYNKAKAELSEEELDLVISEWILDEFSLGFLERQKANGRLSEPQEVRLNKILKLKEMKERYFQK